ncbi:MAG: ABC transporter substrate-binding protein, partial [Anaerolineae bacterium]
MVVEKHTRRSFLCIAALSAAGAIAAACGRWPGGAREEVIQPPPTPEPTDAPTKYHEAPMLAERVARGELPPVDQRLPENPRIAPVIDGIGQYGGTLYLGTLSSSYLGGDQLMASGDFQSNWGRISRDITRAEPNVLQEFHMSDDLTVFTGVMRKGMRWSDGHPLTTEDVRFWYEDLLLNDAYMPMIHSD